MLSLLIASPLILLGRLFLYYFLKLDLIHFHFILISVVKTEESQKKKSKTDLIDTLYNYSASLSFYSLFIVHLLKLHNGSSIFEQDVLYKVIPINLRHNKPLGSWLR